MRRAPGHTRNSKIFRLHPLWVDCALPYPLSIEVYVSQYIWHPHSIYPRILCTPLGYLVSLYELGILVPPTKYPRNFGTPISNILGSLVPQALLSRNFDPPTPNFLGTLVPPYQISYRFGHSHTKYPRNFGIYPYRNFYSKYMHVATGV